MTTPLGSIDGRPARGPPRHDRADDARDRDHGDARASTAPATPGSTPASGSTTTSSARFAHHGLFDLAIHADGDLQIDEHHTVEDVALVLGAAFAEALGDRAGIARFGASSVPMDEALATAVVDVGGRPYAVIDLPFRGERVGGLPLQLVEHALESFARTSGTTLHLLGRRPERPSPGGGRVQGARSRAARRLRDRSAAGRASRRRRASSGDRPPAHRRRRLRRRQPREHRPGAVERRRRRGPSSATARACAAPTRSSSRASGPPSRRWRASTRAA